jgi:hypothetical protein
MTSVVYSSYFSICSSSTTRRRPIFTKQASSKLLTPQFQKQTMRLVKLQQTVGHTHLLENPYLKDPRFVSRFCLRFFAFLKNESFFFFKFVMSSSFLSSQIDWDNIEGPKHRDSKPKAERSASDVILDGKLTSVAQVSSNLLLLIGSFFLSHLFTHHTNTYMYACTQWVRFFSLSLSSLDQLEV